MSSESATKKTTWKKRKPDVQQAAQCWDQVPRDTAEKSKDHAEWELWATLQGKKPDVSSHLGHACSPASTRVTGPFVCLLINYALVCSCCCCCYCWVASVVSDSVQPHWRPPPGSSVPGILQARKMECPPPSPTVGIGEIQEEVHEWALGNSLFLTSGQWAFVGDMAPDYVQWSSAPIMTWMTMEVTLHFYTVASSDRKEKYLFCPFHRNR